MIRYRKCTRALRDGHFDFGRDRDEMDPKPWFWDGIGRDGMGFSRDCFGIFRDFSGIIKYCFLLLILARLSTMMYSLAHLMCLDRFPESLNEYKHCGHLLFLTLLCSHLMCLDRSSESLNKYKHCGHLLFLTLLCSHLMCLNRSSESLNKYQHSGHLLPSACQRS
jgi:hypothetical protein